MIIWAVVILAVIIFFVIGQYNNMIMQRNKCDYAWSQIDVILKKRYDLIPNLVETVKAYATHEKDIFEEVARARSMMTSSQGVESRAEAENMLSGTLKTLFAVAENYPELKANENFLKMQEDLEDIETKISYQRQFYNDAVYAYNTMIQQFPGSVFAGMFHFAVKEYFKTPEEERENVRVKF